jgi:SAM-dependent methyltransferase
MNEWEEYYSRVGSSPDLLVETVVNSLPALPAGAIALDLGAGNMRHAKWLLLRNNFSRVVAVDTCSESESFVTRGIDFYKMPVQNFNPGNQNFDLVIASSVLWFLSQREVEQLIERAYQGLKPGGFLICNLLTDKQSLQCVKGGKSYFSASEIERLSAPYRRSLIREFRSVTVSGGSRCDWLLVIAK